MRWNQKLYSIQLHAAMGTRWPTLKETQDHFEDYSSMRGFKQHTLHKSDMCLTEISHPTSNHIGSRFIHIQGMSTHKLGASLSITLFQNCCDLHFPSWYTIALQVTMWKLYKQSKKNTWGVIMLACCNILNIKSNYGHRLAITGHYHVDRIERHLYFKISLSFMAKFFL